MIYTLTMNPALDKTVVIPHFSVNEVNRISSLRLDAGGKGINVSKVLAKLGGRSRATALLGGSTGKQIREMLEQQGISLDCVEISGRTRTNLKIIDPEGKTNTDINEPGAAVTEEQAQQLFLRFTNRLTAGDIVVLAGSVPGGIPTDIYAKYITACRQTGAKAFLDADGELFARAVPARPYLVKPNQDELSRYVNRQLSTLEEVRAAAMDLVQTGIEKVVVSLGAEGALYVSGQTCLYAPAISVPVGSTVGAGDSVVAALALAEERGLSPEETMKLASATGAANVMCSGTQAAEWAQVESLLTQAVCRLL